MTNPEDFIFPLPSSCMLLFLGLQRKSNVGLTVRLYVKNSLRNDRGLVLSMGDACNTYQTFTRSGKPVPHYGKCFQYLRLAIIYVK